ncbi:MAG: holo-ACP synthase [Pseudomonadales bacterium]|nr:holo-ACP synthase [Pseudomonadales bacterium]
MIVGIGVDIVDTDRMDKSYRRFGDRFAEKILHQDEIQKYHAANNKVSFLAKRFAAKEAVAKALGTGMRAGVHFRQICICNKKTGLPFVKLSAAAETRAAALGVKKIHLSLSDERTNAIAFVVFESTGRE